MPTQEICAVIDRSGSMVGKEKDTIGGINATFNVLRETKTAEDVIKISIKLFDHEQILKIRSLNLDQVRDLTLNDFQPRGQTALLDAIGDTLTYFMEKKLMDSTAFDTCVIYITTDGYENASKRYDNEKIKRMIATAEKIYKISVLYLGANQDAIAEASKYGISGSHAINYSENRENVEAVYRSAASAAVRTRSVGRTEFTQTERIQSQDNYPQDNYPQDNYPQDNNVNTFRSYH